MFRDDIVSIEQVRDLGRMKLLSDMLPERVGSPFSTNAARKDLESGFKAVSHWLDVLESFYYHFRIRPYVHCWIRSIKKEPKVYLWDWSEVLDPAARFENMIAGHLLKLWHFFYDRDRLRAELSFLYFLDKLKFPFGNQVIRKSGVHSLIRGVRVVSAGRFLGGLI